MNTRRERIFFCILVVLSIASVIPLVLRNQHVVVKPKSDAWSKLIACKIDKHYLEGMYGITYTADVKALDGKPITLDGFVMPLEATEKFSHFLLSIRAPSCPYCPPAAPNEMVEVFAKTPITWSDQLVSMRGTLTLGAEKSDTGDFFQLRDADIAPAFTEDAAQANPATITTSTKTIGEYHFAPLNHTVDSASVTVKQWAGKTVLLAFWRSDCAPCLLEMRTLPQIAKQHPDLPIALISLQDAQHTRERLSIVPENVHIFVTPEDGRELLTAFGNDRMLALPYSVMLDAQGAICGKHYGIVTPDIVNAWWKQCSQTK